MHKLSLGTAGALLLLACGGSVESDHSTGGTGGSGGNGGGGAGGSAGNPFCCSTDNDCGGSGGPDYDDGAPWPSVCVAGVCKAFPHEGGRCWRNDDCQFGICNGASVCPCAADCHQEDEPGWCMAPTSPACCSSDVDCGDEAYVACVNGVCKQPVLDACWKNSDCDPGKSCVGASVCPCNAVCDSEDKPGHCM